MALFRWILLLGGVLLIAGIFAYTRGWFAFRWPWPKKVVAEAAADSESVAHPDKPQADPEPPVVAAPEITGQSMVVTVRVMPQAGSQFPAERLILSLRAAGLAHGKYGIFHCLDEELGNRIRYSVASLVEPGSFDLTKLQDSKYNGISIFMVLPATEDGVLLFDDMLQTARVIAKAIDGRMVDESGGALSVQRERYMREEVIDFLRRHNQPKNHLAS